MGRPGSSAPGDFYEVLFHKGADRLAARHAPNSFDIRPEDRLLIGDDGQRLERAFVSFDFESASF